MIRGDILVLEAISVLIFILFAKNNFAVILVLVRENIIDDTIVIITYCYSTTAKRLRARALTSVQRFLWDFASLRQQIDSGVARCLRTFPSPSFFSPSSVPFFPCPFLILLPTSKQFPARSLGAENSQSARTSFHRVRGTPRTLYPDSAVNLQHCHWLLSSEYEQLNSTRPLQQAIEHRRADSQWRRACLATAWPQLPACLHGNSANSSSSQQRAICRIGAAVASSLASVFPWPSVRRVGFLSFHVGQNDVIRLLKALGTTGDHTPAGRDAAAVSRRVVYWHRYTGELAGVKCYAYCTYAARLVTHCWWRHKNNIT